MLDKKKKEDKKGGGGGGRGEGEESTLVKQVMAKSSK